MERIIKANDSSFRFLSPNKLWRARTILFFLIRRDIVVTYKQTLLGVLWALIKPIALSLIFVFVFKELADFPDYGFPYILISLCALSIWEFFSSAINKGSSSLVDERDLITKINFPRVLIPVGASVSNTVAFGLNLILIIVLMVIYEVPFSFRLVLIPLIVFALLIINIAFNLWLSSLNVFFRDVEQIVPFALRLGLFLSPVGFTLKSVPEEWQLLYCLNPMVSVIELMRYAVLGNQFLPDLNCILMSTCSLLIILGGGLYYFGKSERKFADVI